MLTRRLNQSICTIYISKMKKYIYYSKFDSKQEPQGKLEAINLEDAILLASHYKEMSKEDFLNVFEVKEYEREKTNNNNRSSR